MHAQAGQITVVGESGEVSLEWQASETAFQEMRAHLGFDAARHRVGPRLPGLFTAILLIYARQSQQGGLEIQARAQWQEPSQGARLRLLGGTDLRHGDRILSLYVLRRLVDTAVQGYVRDHKGEDVPGLCFLGR